MMSTFAERRAAAAGERLPGRKTARESRGGPEKSGARPSGQVGVFQEILDQSPRVQMQMRLTEALQRRSSHSSANTTPVVQRLRTAGQFQLEKNKHGKLIGLIDKFHEARMEVGNRTYEDVELRMFAEMLEAISDQAWKDHLDNVDLEAWDERRYLKRRGTLKPDYLTAGSLPYYGSQIPPSKDVESDTISQLPPGVFDKNKIVGQEENKKSATFGSFKPVDPDGGSLKMVLAQAAYMSGDMFGVAAALRLDPLLGVVIFYDNRNKRREIQDTLFDFYRMKDDEKRPRVALIPVDNSQLAYKKAIAGDFSDKWLFPSGTPQILSSVKKPSPIGNATRIVADHYKKGPEKAREVIEQEWLPKGTKEGTAKGKSGKTIAKWVDEKGFKPGASYAFIWFRQSGAKGGAHEELDTSEKATSQIIKATKKEKSQAVLIGDSGYKGKYPPDIDLAEFWNEADSPFHGSGRKMQLALFSYLKLNHYNIMNVGMRSGALEGPALLGIKTVFLEEKYNFQGNRMSQWQGVVPDFERVELEHVPTKAGKEVLWKLILDTEKVKEDDYWKAIEELEKLLDSVRSDKLKLHNIIPKWAAEPAKGHAGISVTEGIYDPADVDEVFRNAIKEIDKGQKEKTYDALGYKGGPTFVKKLRAAIGAYQEWRKASVKRQLDEDYYKGEGPQEGLIKGDRFNISTAIEKKLGPKKKE